MPFFNQNMFVGNHKMFLNELGHFVVYFHQKIQLYYTNAVALITLFAIITGYRIYYRKSNLAVFMKQMLAILGTLYCSYLASAPVWNHMRRPALFQNTVNGRNYVDNRPKGQYLAESYIVAMSNAAIAIGMILLIEGLNGVKNIKRGSQVGKKWLRILQSCIGLILICVFFSLLLCMQRTKRHYPYKFLFE